MKQWDEIALTIYTESATKDLELEIQRNRQKIILQLRRADIPDISEEKFGIFPVGLIPVVSSVDHGKPAEKIGLQPGDTILAVGSTPVCLGLLQEIIHANAGKEIILTWKRGNQKMNAHVIPNAEGFIGISLSVAYHGPLGHEQYSLFAALPAGIQELKITSVLFFTNIYKILIGKASLRKSIGGPIEIAKIAKASAEVGIIEYIGLIGLLSISLALINILPFPALDGGHLAFLGYEAVFRREIPSKVKIVLQQVGFILLLVFMAFVLYNDVVKY